MTRIKCCRRFWNQSLCECLNTIYFLLIFIYILNFQKIVLHGNWEHLLLLRYFQEIHSSENLFRLIVQSLCPSIFGQEMVKAGLILGLIGGTEAEGGSRPNPHVLIVGDPGLGKSQLLQAATLAAPRGNNSLKLGTRQQ